MLGEWERCLGEEGRDAGGSGQRWGQWAALAQPLLAALGALVVPGLWWWLDLTWLGVWSLLGVVSLGVWSLLGCGHSWGVVTQGVVTRGVVTPVPS